MPKSAGERLRFTFLRLQNWRKFTQVECPLAGRAFLVGPNASGKSNLLDVFRFLRDLVSVGGGLQSAVARRGGISRLRCLAARRPPEIHIYVQVGSEERPNQWEYELWFDQRDRKDPRPYILKERVVFESQELLARPNLEDNADPERLTQTHLEQVYVNQSVRPLAEFFATVQYLHLVPQIIREPDRAVGKVQDPFGGDFLERIAATGEKLRRSRLRSIRKALQIAVPQLQELELWRDGKGVPHLRGKYEHWRPRGAWQTEEQFSDGTLRLLGLLWIMLEGQGPLLLEEPELSLHPGVVRYIPQMFARMQSRTGRQILLSTHSTEILRDSGIGLDEVVLFIPTKEGTKVQLTSQRVNILRLLEGGLDLADAVFPQTAPANLHQLSFWEET